MFFRFRFLIFFLLFKNLCCLLLSNDLFRLYCIGFNLSFCILLQIICGVLLSWLFFNCFIIDNFYYIFLIGDFDLGFFVRSFHILFTSIIFLLIYLHIIKTILMCLAFDIHIITWAIGYIIFIILIIIAFIGYTLPCTSMSYWGLTVFSNILATLPFIGNFIVQWVWGSEYINDFTLVKLHSIHIILPFILSFFIILHFFFLHFFLSSDNLLDRYNFYYERTFFFLYFYIKDLSLLLWLLIIYNYFVFIFWYFVFHEESWYIVNVLKTSDKILPELILLFLVFFNNVSQKKGWSF